MRVTHSRYRAPAAVSRLSAVPKAHSISLLAIGLASVFVVDSRTAEAPVQHLYYIPLIFAALRFGAAGGLLAALVAIGLYHVANARFSPAAFDEADFLQIVLFIAVPLITAKLADDARRLRQLASTDDLTGLLNLRGFEEQVEAAVRESRAGGSVMSMLVLDVDGLKRLNDSYGHLAGADAVRTVGRIIGDVLPPGAAACRYGGDEFAIVVRGSATEAVRFADTLVCRVRQTSPTLAARRMPEGTLSVSIGIASRVFESVEDSPAQDAADGEALFRAADQALYVAKANGKDRTEVAE